MTRATLGGCGPAGGWHLLAGGAVNRGDAVGKGLGDSVPHTQAMHSHGLLLPHARSRGIP